MTVTIYHNPKCSTSRKVLELIRDRTADFEVVDYLRTPPGVTELTRLVAGLGTGARSLLRRKGTPYDALGLDDPGLSEAALIAAMAREPILIERPLVVTPKGTRICRPVETVLDLL